MAGYGICSKKSIYEMMCFSWRSIHELPIIKWIQISIHLLKPRAFFNTNIIFPGRAIPISKIRWPLSTVDKDFNCLYRDINMQNNFFVCSKLFSTQRVTYPQLIIHTTIILLF